MWRDAGRALEEMIRVWKATSDGSSSSSRLSGWFSRIDEWRSRDCLRYVDRSDAIMPQRAIETLYRMTKDRDAIISTEVGSASDVGCAVLSF